MRRKPKITVPEAFVEGYETVFETEIKRLKEDIQTMLQISEEVQLSEYRRTYKLFRQKRHLGNLYFGKTAIGISWAYNSNPIVADEFSAIVEHVNHTQGEKLYGINSSPICREYDYELTYTDTYKHIGTQAFFGVQELGTFSTFFGSQQIVTATDEKHIG